MRDLVSIVIPVYNAIPYLEECLNSAINQTYQHLEIIVINDGSTDTSEQVLQKFAAADPRIQLYRQENHGLGFTRNRGIALSSGTYLFFLDADDVIPENAIQSLIKAARRKDADYAVGKVVRFTGSRMYLPIRHLEFKLYQQTVLTTLDAKPELLQDSIACNKLWKKDFLVKHGLAFKEGKYYEDLALTLKAAVFAKKIQVINEIVYHWRTREDEEKPSITQQQMKLENTRHRLEELAENRKWLLESRIQERIIKEHDLKSLLDVLRLHVLKFAAIHEEEKEEWLKIVQIFLENIPAGIAEKLPDKEKLMYSLLKQGNTEDLVLFSKALMYTETAAIVHQEQHRFVLKGSQSDFDVTAFLKPVMIVAQVEEHKGIWRLEGQLRVPKASYLPEGKLYLVDRMTAQETALAPLQLKQTAAGSCYPYEELHFIALLQTDPLLAQKKAAVYDFYYRLAAYPQSDPSRVRILPDAAEAKKEKKTGNFTLTLYRTQYGNLSLILRKEGLKHLIKKKISPLLRS